MKKFPSPPLKIGASLPEPQKLKLVPQEAIQSMVEVTSATSANDHNKPVVAIFNKSPRICVCTAATGENIGLLPDLHSMAIILCNPPHPYLMIQKVCWAPKEGRYFFCPCLFHFLRQESLQNQSLSAASSGIWCFYNLPVSCSESDCYNLIIFKSSSLLALSVQISFSYRKTSLCF